MLCQNFSVQSMEMADEIKICRVQWQLFSNVAAWGISSVDYKVLEISKSSCHAFCQFALEILARVSVS